VTAEVRLLGRAFQQEDSMLGINVVNALRAKEQVMQTEQDSVPLEPYEENLTRFDDITIGTQVRLSETTLAEMKAAGIAEVARDSWRLGGTVTQIVTHPHHGWVSLRVRLTQPVRYADGTGHRYQWWSPADLSRR